MAARTAFIDDLSAIATVVLEGAESLLTAATKADLGVLASGLSVTGWRRMRKAALVAALAEELATSSDDRPRG